MALAESFRLIFIAFYLLLLTQYVLAFPIQSTLPRGPAIVKTSGSGNAATVSVFDSDSLQPITQTSASDGSGVGFASSAPSILWFGFCLLFGLPLALAGIRGRRFTTGAAFGLAFGVCCTSVSPSPRRSCS